MKIRNRKISNWYFLPVILLILLISGAVYLNYTWKPVLTARIKEAVKTSTNGLYQIEFENIRINVITGRLSVSGIHFIPDTAVYQQMSADSIAPRHLYKVNVSKLVLNRVNPFKIYFNRILEMGSVVIEKPSLEISYSAVINTADSLKDDSRTAWQRLKPYLRKVNIGDITFRDADFRYIDQTTGGGNVTSLKNLTLKINDLLIDSTSQFDASRFYYTRDIYAEVNNYRTLTADSNYVVRIQHLQASTSGGYASVKGFKLVPRYGELEFSSRADFMKERYSVALAEFRLNRIDFKLLNTERRLSAGSMLFETLNMSIFLNRELPDSLRDKSMNFPQHALRRFRLNTLIDTVHVRNSTVNYAEYNPESRRKGTATFSKINGHILNVTNDSAALARNHLAKADLTALLMDRGRLNVNLNFDLASRSAAFDFKGSVGLMDASILNTAIRPLSLIEIRSGTLDHLEFSGRGSTSGIKGRLTLKYNDLKVSLLEKSESTSWLKRKGIASIFANVLIIRSDNPMPGQAPRSASFVYERPAHGSFFNLIWKGMASALLESIGFDAATQREIQRRLKKMEIDKAEREQRRDDRLKKRDERRSRRND